MTAMNSLKNELFVWCWYKYFIITLHAQKIAIKPVISTYISPIARIISILLSLFLNSFTEIWKTHFQPAKVLK